MISRLTVRRFKRFDEAVFDLPGHVVIAGPNNTGKTTALQAIASWDVGLRRWRELNNPAKHGGYYVKAPIARQAFSPVPLRTFDLLWRGRSYREKIVIEVRGTAGWTVALEFERNSTEQLSVRPTRETTGEALAQADFAVSYVPPMSGLSTEEPVYQRPKLDQLLGQAKPGEVLRNLLVEAHRDQAAWVDLQDSIGRLFHFELLPPDDLGANITAEYRHLDTEARYDVASGGSGFQQVLLLLTFLNTRPASVLLLDEPDAHLHVILQDAIYGELRRVAEKQRSQLVIATHSEVIINSVEPRELCLLLDLPRMVTDVAERARLNKALRVLSNMDITLAMTAPGILYVENYTDLNILREWARILQHPAYEYLSARVFWRPTVSDTRLGGPGVRSRDHHEALCLVREDYPALEIVDRDARESIESTSITGCGLQRMRWKRYEIENYLVHPGALQRYVVSKIGEAVSAPHIEDLYEHFRATYPPAFLEDPLADLPAISRAKARTELLPPALEAAGLIGVEYTDYDEIAAVMTPDEIHPDVREMLDAIVGALNL